MVGGNAATAARSEHTVQPALYVGPLPHARPARNHRFATLKGRDPLIPVLPTPPTGKPAGRNAETAECRWVFLPQNCAYLAVSTDQSELDKWSSGS